MDEGSLGYLEVSANNKEPCDVMSDFTNNQSVYVVSLVSITVIILCTVACLGVCCRYRRLQSQYYERVQLIRGGTNSRNSDVSVRSAPGGKRRIQYRVEEE